eukprot:CAMPEP_0171189202 /NCGR_PEP_ID=MMETSP0790-20130122/18224_1 /TAXON_ID=2925 /ORGANISM="Alexandrium catenella, Strain OF101" /LENGTH=65 /DNA_ID=CAMNT_0011654305 /DNA_START=264 /DNA_END=462 /DNA_ORIENTATION=-
MAMHARGADVPKQRNCTMRGIRIPLAAAAWHQEEKNEAWHAEAPKEQEYGNCSGDLLPLQESSGA